MEHLKPITSYENRFSEILALVAYTDAGRSHDAFTISPELTTSGILPKAGWLTEGDGIYLYKGKTCGASNTSREPYCEATVMGLTAAHYNLENWKGIATSKCRLSTDIATAFIPIAHIVRRAAAEYSGV